MRIPVNFALYWKAFFVERLLSSSITSLDLFAAIIIQEINDSTFPDFVWKPFSVSISFSAAVEGNISVNSSPKDPWFIER
jgi:hypothetical protein